MNEIIEVELPDGTIAEFPGNMSHQEIEGILQKQFPPMQPMETKGISGVGQDLMQLIKSSPHLLRQAIQATPGEAVGVAQNPERIPQNLLAGLIGVGHGVASAPPALADYLARKDIISPEMASYVPRPPQGFDAADVVGLGEQMPGDVLGQLAGSFIGAGPAAGSAARGVGKIASSAGKFSEEALKKGVKALSEGQVGQTARALSSTKTGEVLKKGFAQDLENSRKMYSDVSNLAKEKGVGQIPVNVTMEDLSKIKDVAPEKAIRKLQHALENNNFDNLHDAQSDLLRWKRSVDKRIDSGRDVSIAERQAASLAKDLSESIQESIFRELMKKGGLDLPFKYIEAGDNYFRNVTPWENLPSARGALKEPGQPNFRYPSNLPRETSSKKANPFLSGKGQEFPELLINRKLASPYGKLLETLSGLGIFKGLID
jgi:hypothetical protein